MAFHEAFVPVILAIFYGVIAAAAYAGAGFFKARGSNPEESFDKQKFLSTLLLGLLLGGIGGGLGWSPQTAEAWLAGLGLLGGVLVGIDWLAKGILRRIEGKSLSEDTGGQLDVISLVALLTAIPSVLGAYFLFLLFVGGNGLILGSVLGAIGILTTKILIDRKKTKENDGSRS